VAVRQVSLEGDAGREPGEVSGPERGSEGLDRYVEVAVLFHVQVDELGWPVGSCCPVEGAKWAYDSGDRALKVNQRKACRDGGGLDRDAVHVLAPEQGLDCGCPPGCLGVAQDRLAQQVDVGPAPCGPHPRQAPPKGRGLGGEDEGPRLVPQALTYERHNGERGGRRRPRRQAQQGGVGGGEALHGPSRYVSQLGCCRLGVKGPERPVGEGEHKARPRGAREQPPEAPLAAALERAAQLAGAGKQGCGQFRGLSYELAVGHHAPITPITSLKRPPLATMAAEQGQRRLVPRPGEVREPGKPVELATLSVGSCARWALPVRVRQSCLAAPVACG
jgi:hypothetical protein